MRFRITQTITIEYDVDPTNYVMPLETTEPTPQEMLALDIRSFEDDPEIMISYVEENEDDMIHKVEGEVINDL